MDKIAITNIQRLCVNDGPGVRTVVFLRGCSLQCPWCCNPETIHIADTEIFDKGLCDYPSQKIYCERCVKLSGNRPITECPVRAYEQTYKDYSSEELIETLDEGIKDGVTFSGGEPLLQIKAMLPVIEYLKKQGISIAMETSLYVPRENSKQALPYVDHWLVDLKFQYGYIPNKEFQIQSDEVFQNIQELLQMVSADNIAFRMVLMREAMANRDDIVKKLVENKIKKIELLEYHSLAENKYRQLNKIFRPFHSPTEEDVRIISSLLDKYNIRNSYLRI